MDRRTVQRTYVRAVFGIAAVALASAAQAHTTQLGESGEVTISTIKIGKDRSMIEGLVADGYDIGGVSLENGTVDVLTRTKDEGLSLRFLGYPVEGQKTIDTTLAPEADYKTPDEIAAILRQLHDAHPAITRLESIGKTVENRDIWALKIALDPESHDPRKPSILFNGMHHAREIMTPEVVLDTAEVLLTKYGQDPQVTHWVESNEIWLVPMLNSDGNNKVWNGNSMWRKNTRGNFGVDVNRNYPYAWGTCNGSSGSSWSDTYRGPSAGSEPETQALMGLVARIQPVFDISYHSYSELVIYPYGCDDSRTETREVVERVGRDMAGKIVTDSGQGTYAPGTAWELLYAVDGGDIDWMYHEHNVIPMVIEINSSSLGFQPAYSNRQPTVEKMRPAWQYLFEQLDASGIRGMITDGAGRAQPSTYVTVQGLGASAKAPFTWKVKNDGSYHIVLNPGAYTLKFDLNGQTVEKNVTVGAERVDMDVQF